MAILKQIKTPFGKIRITRDRDGTLAYFQNGCFHSQANANGVSICAYVHVLYQIIIQKQWRSKTPKRVLMIGCAGGTLATMLVRAGCEVTVVDINPAAFDIARDYFRMPAQVTCIGQNGLTYIRTTTQRYHAVVVDVFSSENAVPRGFATQGFFSAAKSVLIRGGILMQNIMIKNAQDKRADKFARAMHMAGMQVRLWCWPKEQNHNALVVGGAVRGIMIPSGREPSFIKQDLKGLVCKTLK